MLTPAGNYDFTLAAGTVILPIGSLELEDAGNGALIAKITDETGRTDHCVISTDP